MFLDENGRRINIVAFLIKKMEGFVIFFCGITVDCIKKCLQKDIQDYCPRLAMMWDDGIPMLKTAQSPKIEISFSR